MSSTLSTTDAGSFSAFCTRFLRRRYLGRKRAANPVAQRTRTGAKSHVSSRISKTTSPKSGSILRNAASPIVQRRGANTLSTQRANLKSFVRASIRDGTAGKTWEVTKRLAQLGPLNLLPTPFPVKIPLKSDLEVQKAKARGRRSALRHVEMVLNEEQMEIEYALLPGEENSDEDGALDAEMFVLEWEEEDKTVLKDMERTGRMAGVWESVVGKVGGDDEVMKAARMMWEEQAGAVMNPQCVDVVSGVWEMVGGRE